MKTKRGKSIVLCAVLIALGSMLLPGVPAYLTRGVDADDSVAALSGAELRSGPSDKTPYGRPLVPGDAPSAEDPLGVPGGPWIFPNIAVIDVVINNTNANLTNTDGANDGETSIAINPEDTDEMVMSAFSGGWSGPGTTATLYHTTDGGGTWTQVGVPPPPGWSDAGCPCDWAWDWGQGGLLSGTYLAQQVAAVPPAFNGDIVSVVTTDPATVGAYAYNGNPAQRTNNNVATSFTISDQPWVLVNRSTGNPAVDNVYVAYDDFSGSPDMQCAVSANVSPLDFTLDVKLGDSTSGVNPGLRLADDRGSGVMWALWGRNTGPGDDTSKAMDYMLNRTTDNGATWTLNGDPNLPATAGIVVASADSTQPQPKFGTVNALLGGVHHAGVDPGTGDLYYVYGNRDPATNNNRLAVRRITDAGGGAVNVGAEVFLTGQVEAALPSVAVLDNGTVGVFYYTYDGMSGGFPQFTAHFSISRDQGATWTNRVLVQFLSSATDSGNARQRVLGDYMQVKALGSCFYGSFTANGAPFGRPFSNHDPIFFFTCAPNVVVTCPPDQDVECGVEETLTFDVDELNNLGVTVTFDVDGVPVPGQTKVIAAGTTPTTADFAFTYGGPPGSTYDVTATGTNTAGESFDCTVTVTVVDTTDPVVTCGVTRGILWPARGGLVNVGFTRSATDVCEPPGSLTYTVTVRSDEADGPPPFTPDVLFRGGTLYLLRSDRDIQMDGRVYVFLVEAEDTTGNRGFECCTAVVPRIPTVGHIMGALAQATAARNECLANNGATPTTAPFQLHP